LFGTEITLLFGHGNITHDYTPGAFVTAGAQKWLEQAQIGHNTPENIAIQLEAFTVSGCAEQLEEPQKPKESKY